MGIYAQNIARDAVVDFGFLKDGAGRFEPALLGTPRNFRGFVFPGDLVRYGIEVVADNATSKALHYFDVKWDGKWEDDDDKMLFHLTVTPA